MLPALILLLIIAHYCSFRSDSGNFRKKFAWNVSLLYLCSDGKSPVVKFYISKAFRALAFQRKSPISTQITEDKAVKRTLMLVAYPLPATRGDSISDKAWEWTVYFVIGVWRYLFGNKPRNCPRFFVSINLYILGDLDGGTEFSTGHLSQPRRACFHSCSTVSGCH